MKAKVFDPLRRIEVPLTPEEQVRQWFIGILIEHSKVPRSLMNSEVAFNLGGKQYRADILIWDRNARPLALVECKQPSVTLNNDVLDQAICYDMALNLRWIILTNGKKTIVLRKNDGKFVNVNFIPDYETMVQESDE